MEVTEGSFHLDLHTVLADDEHSVALAVATASRGGRSIEVNEAQVFHLHDGKVVEFWNAPPISTSPTSSSADRAAMSLGGHAQPIRCGRAVNIREVRCAFWARPAAWPSPPPPLPPPGRSSPGAAQDTSARSGNSARLLTAATAAIHSPSADQSERR